MNFNNITIGDILVIIAGLTTIVGFISKVKTPVDSFNTRITKIEQRQAIDDERLKALEDDTKLILKATRVLIAHSVTNNETGELRKVQAEIDEYLINK